MFVYVHTRKYSTNMYIHTRGFRNSFLYLEIYFLFPQIMLNGYLRVILGIFRVSVIGTRLYVKVQPTDSPTQMN